MALLQPITAIVEEGSIGVVVGRFQVDDLHQGHRDLLETVMNRHKVVIVFLGVAAVHGTKRNPLDYITRKVMLESTYNAEWQAKHGVTLIIDKIPNNRSDKEWSYELDARIAEHRFTHKVYLYGGKDSFAGKYFGYYPVIALEPSTYFSGTNVRKAVSTEILADAKFRKGVIYGCTNRYDIAWPCADIAVFRYSEDHKQTWLLLGRKPDELEFRFPGGHFAIDKDKGLENTALRELSEEAGPIEVTAPRYVTSCLVEGDWRYVDESDKILTTLFASEYIFGVIQPGDDLEEVRWVDLEEVKQRKEELLVPEHVFLFDAFLGHHLTRL